MASTPAIKIIEQSGPPHQQGLAYGQALAGEMRTALDGLLGGLARFHQADRETIFQRALSFWPAAQDFDPELEEYVSGQAQGAGLEFAEAWTLRCTLELMFHFAPMPVGCTSFALTGPASADREPLLGQNLDWFSGTPLALLRVERPDGLRQLTLALVGVSEYTLSSAGLGVCANGTLTLAPGPGPRIPYLAYMPRVMRQTSLEAAQALLLEACRGVGYFHLVDAKGRAWGIESDLSSATPLEPREGVLAHANHYLHPAYAAHDGAPQFFPDSHRRLERMEHLLAQGHGDWTPALLQRVLADHQDHPNSICRHPDPQAPPGMAAESLASYIMLPARGIMLLAPGNPCQTPYAEYRL